jgi:hypothetical protein
MYPSQKRIEMIGYSGVYNLGAIKASYILMALKMVYT